MSSTLGIVYFPAALALGALHALEPGHAKALTASYLIGINGTKKDSVVLGLSVAATHSIVVIGISAIGLWLGNEAFSGQATAWLERGSGLVARLSAASVGFVRRALTVYPISA
jgi:nickel/cobalt exporter